MKSFLSKTWIYLILVLLIGGIFVLIKTTNSETKTMNNNQTPQPTNSPIPVGSPTTSLKIEDEVVGTGTEAVAGKKVTVNYLGTLTDGTKFDSSYDRNQPFTFNLGGGEVIKGWDQGVVGMKVGGKRKLTIPADLAYGSRDLPGIPANSTLIFEVELLKVE